jgi:subtilisin-like proprotein convertase family protein
MTNPSSRQWDGADSQLIISAISSPGDVITFSVGEESTLQVIRGEATPALKIPDNNPTGVNSTIAITQPGTTGQVKVGVDITHTYIGDLVVEIVSPSGQRATLHSRSGAGLDNLITTYDSATVAALAPLIGIPVQGDWVLHVRDVAGRDVGKLNRWSLEIGLKTSSTVVRGDASPNQEIPDNDPVGVSSIIAIDQPGTVRQVKVSVNITHTYVGDLRIEILSPSARGAVIHGRLGGGQDDLVITYDSTAPSSALTPLIGQPMQGNWVLRVADLAGKDVGTLNQWSLELTAGD